MVIPSEEYLLKRPKHIAQVLKKEFPEFLTHIASFPGNSISEKCYRYFHPEATGLCPICGQPVKFNTYTLGYHHYCSRKCMRRDPAFMEKSKVTNLKRYGCEFPTQSKIIKKKTRATNLKRYGCHPRALKEIQEKQAQTCLERYGNPNYRNPEQYKKTCLERYGVDNISQIDSIKEKKATTTQLHYGVDNPFQAVVVKEKIKQTMLSKYGVEYGSQISAAERMDHMIQTNIEKYGVPYGFLNTLPGYSKISQLFFNCLKDDYPNAVYATNGGEHRIGRYTLDWYDPDSNTAIEFNGDYWHANPKYYKPDWVHPIKKCTAKELWEHDKQKYDYLTSLGITVYVVWESDVQLDLL